MDPDEAERLTRQFRGELKELDVESIARATPPVTPPAGAKGDLSDWSALLITLSAAGGVFTTLIGMTRDWLVRHPAARRISVTIDGDTIELERASVAERSALIEAYLRRHGSE